MAAGKNMIIGKRKDDFNNVKNERNMSFASDIVTNDEDADMLLTSNHFPNESPGLMFPNFREETHSNEAFKGSQLVYDGSHGQACSNHHTPLGHIYSINSHDMLFCTENTNVISDQADMIQSDKKNVDSVQVALPPPLKKRTLNVAFSDVVSTSHFIDDDSSLDDFIGIVDAAFRYAICDNPNKLRAGIKIHGNTMKTKLQSINPTMWSPGYAQAVATRAALIPTLACSFSKFMSNTGGGQKTVETISTFLLETTQRGLQNPKAACKLKPLSRNPSQSRH